MFIGRTDAEAETAIVWPPDLKNWLSGKDPDAGKDWRREEKGMTEVEMGGWHHWLDGHGFEQGPGDGDGQGGVLQSMGRRVRHNWDTELKCSMYILNDSSLSDVSFANVFSQSMACLLILLTLPFAEQKFLNFDEVQFTQNFLTAPSAFGGLVPQPGVKHGPLSVKLNPNHWNAREFLINYFLHGSCKKNFSLLILFNKFSLINKGYNNKYITVFSILYYFNYLRATRSKRQFCIVYKFKVVIILHLICSNQFKHLWSIFYMPCTMLSISLWSWLKESMFCTRLEYKQWRTVP